MKEKEFFNIAFISYKREDEKWAKWLQQKLQYYKLPTEIRRKHIDFVEKPRRVFKDTTDLSGGVLEKAIKTGLETSKFLIVICSPRAAQSSWICKEVEEFIDVGREEYIIPFIIEGEPHAKDLNNECFPEALRSLTGERELLGININENGREAAAVKVVARMFEVNFDFLWQRFKRSHKNRLIKIWVALLLLITSLMGLAFYIQEKNNQLEKSNYLMALNRNRYVLKEAFDLIHEGDIYTAQRLCRDLIIHGDTDALIKPEIEKVLYAAEDNLKSPYKQIAIFKEHSGSVEKVCFSPNGEFIASIDWDSKVIVRKTCSGEIVCTIDAVKSSRGSQQIEFSPNGQNLLISGNGIGIFNFRTGEIINIIDECGKNATYNKRGDKIFYVDSKGEAFLYDCKTKRKEHIFKDSKKSCIMGKFSPTDDSLALLIEEVWGKKYFLYHIDNKGKLICKILVHERSVCDIAFSPDGKMVVSASTDNKAKVWNLKTGSLSSTFNETHDYVTSVKYESNGKFIISTGYKNIYLWNPQNGNLIKELKGHNRLTNDVDISSDGKYAVSASLDNTVRLWTLESDTKTSSFRKIMSGYGSIDWIPNNDSTVLLCVYGYVDKKCGIYNVKTNNVQQTKCYGLGTIPVFTDNETCFVSICVDGYIRKWSAVSGQIVDSVLINDKDVALDFSYSYDYHLESSNKDKDNAYISGKANTYLYNFSKNEFVKILNKRILYYDNVNYKGIIGDGNGKISIIALNGDSLFSLPVGVSDSYDFSKDGKFIASSNRYSINVWKANTREKVFSNADSKENIISCKFSNNSKYLVSGGGFSDPEMRIWDVNSWTCILFKQFPEMCDDFFWINKDKSLLMRYGDCIYRLDLPNYYSIIKELDEKYKNMELSSAEKKLYFTN